MVIHFKRITITKTCKTKMFLVYEQIDVNIKSMVRKYQVDDRFMIIANPQILQHGHKEGMEYMIHWSDEL